MAFRVPRSVELDTMEPFGSDSGVSQPNFTDSGIADHGPPPMATETPEEPQIEFLCPNGHRLQGPAHVQGGPGECPECGARFRIPNCEPVSTEHGIAPEISLNPVEGGAGAHAGAPLNATANYPPDRPARYAPVAGQAEPTAIRPPVAGDDAAGPTMASLFVRLWHVRREAATVELRLRDGESLIPDQFLEALSSPSHGVFAVRETDGSISLVAVAWESVVRATLRGLSELPAELTS